MWLSEIMRWEFYCRALWAWHQSVRRRAAGLWCAGSLVWSALCWSLWAHNHCSCGSAMHFKVGDQGSTCAWHPENDNASASLHLLQDTSPPNTKGRRQRPQYFSSWRKHIFTTVIYIQEESSALSAFYTNTVGQRQCGKGQQRRHTGNRFFEALCLTAEALIDKSHHHTAYLYRKIPHYLVYFKTNMYNSVIKAFSKWALSATLIFYSWSTDVNNSHSRFSLINKSGAVAWIANTNLQV